MFKIMLRRNIKEARSPYICKWSFECFGRWVEIGLSDEEFSTIKEKTRTFFRTTPKVKSYLHSVKEKVEEKREATKTKVQGSHLKKHVEKETSAT